MEHKTSFIDGHICSNFNEYRIYLLIHVNPAVNFIYCVNRLSVRQVTSDSTRGSGGVTNSTWGSGGVTNHYKPKWWPLRATISFSTTGPALQLMSQWSLQIQNCFSHYTEVIRSVDLLIMKLTEKIWFSDRSSTQWRYINTMTLHQYVTIAIQIICFARLYYRMTQLFKIELSLWFFGRNSKENIPLYHWKNK